jgi:hypothetical protein
LCVVSKRVNLIHHNASYRFLCPSEWLNCSKFLLYVQSIESGSSKGYHMYTQFQVYAFFIFASRLQPFENMWMCHFWLRRPLTLTRDTSGYLDEFETADRWVQLGDGTLPGNLDRTLALHFTRQYIPVVILRTELEMCGLIFCSLPVTLRTTRFNC